MFYPIFSEIWKNKVIKFSLLFRYFLFFIFFHYIIFTQSTKDKKFFFFTVKGKTEKKKKKIRFFFCFILFCKNNFDEIFFFFSIKTRSSIVNQLKPLTSFVKKLKKKKKFIVNSWQLLKKLSVFEWIMLFVMVINSHLI